MAGKRRKKKRVRERAAARLLALFFAVALAAALLVAGLRLYRDVQNNEAAIESLEEEIKDESARAESLRDKLEQGVTESYVKEEARKMGLAESDDTIYRVEPQK